MNNFEEIINKLAVVCIFEVIVLSFAIVYGLRNGFRLWNWIIIIACILAYIVFTVVVIRKENKSKKQVPPEQLTVSEVYRDQAQHILNSLDAYLKDHPKLANDLKLYWPLYKAALKCISRGKKLHGSDCGIPAQLQCWQQANGEDSFLQKLYDVLVNNII